VVSLDLMSTLVTGILGASAVLANQPIFIDIAIVVSLITFLGTIGFARYLEKRVRPASQSQRKTSNA
jgi:multicomponent Na+:H+ antiporter subunit F